MRSESFKVFGRKNCKNYLLCKWRRKAIANKENIWSTYILIITFRGIAINYKIHLKTQLLFLDNFTDHNLGSPRSRHSHFKIWLTICMFMAFIMLKGVFMEALRTLCHIEGAEIF